MSDESAKSYARPVRAVVYDEFSGPLRVTEVPDPVPPPGGVVLKVGAAGLCRSDWHAWRGLDDVGALPHVPGHEFAGVVSAVDSGVTRWRVGDRVTVPFVCACGSCRVCESGEHQVCPHQWQPGFDGWGGFAEFVALPAADTNLVALPPTMPMTAAAGLGCRLATAYRAVAVVGRATPGDEVVIHGAGGVGLAAVSVARAMGGRVTVVDPSPQARELARSLGAAHTLDPSEGALVDRLREATDGGPSLSVEAVGSVEACRASVSSLRPRGRHVQVGLLPPSETTEPVPMHEVIARELQVLGSHGMSAAYYSDLLALIAQGRLRPDLLVTSVIGLDDVPDAMTRIGQPDQPAGITVIVP